MANDSILDNKEEFRKIGLRLKNLRKAKGYTSPDKFAYENNINRSQYGKYEAGSANITVGTLINLLNCYNLSLSQFFNEDYDNTNK